MKRPKKKYYIMLNGEYVGETWAVSPAKARVNYWWKFSKGCNPYTLRDMDPEDFDVVEA